MSDSEVRLAEGAGTDVVALCINTTSTRNATSRRVCFQRVLSENVEWINLWKQELENTQLQPAGSEALDQPSMITFLEHTNEVLCFLAKENQKGYNKCANSPCVLHCCCSPPVSSGAKVL